ncbi:MAG TPA: aminotransferase class V-fold PLP-dependent enzyme [Thermoanaerobaculia bacterium]|nr:aminotransferase class V-fold PLP-dependent enzyme [Thermoanaerobaculia bacterium]
MIEAKHESPVAPADEAAGTARPSPLAMDADEFRRLGHQLVDAVGTFLATLAERPVTPGESPDQVRAVLGADRPLPAEGTDPAALLAGAAELLFGHSLLNGHPRFLGYITSSPAPLGVLAELLAAAVNANVGAWRLSPMASEIEAQTVRWIAELVGYPAGCGGLFTSGGNMANFVGLLAARAAKAADLEEGWDLRAEGLQAPAARRLRIYASAETHTWIQKAADLSGLGTDAIRWLPTGDDLRLDLAALRVALARDRAAGDVPMLVVGTAGSVSTGAVDPLAEIAAISREAGAWFHVDGAYGAFAARVPGAPAALADLALADSLAVDPHKWLYAPLEAGCVLVRDPETLRRAFSYHPPYYHFGQEATNFVDFGPQNSRGFRALKVWLTLRQVGRDGTLRMIGDDIRLSRRLHAAVAAHPELQPFTQALSINTFRYVPPDLRERAERAAARQAGEAAGDEAGVHEIDDLLNRLNEALLERIQSGGECFVSNAVVRGRYLLRSCIVNFNTREPDIDALPEIVARLGREVDRELRAAEGATRFPPLTRAP